MAFTDPDTLTPTGTRWRVGDIIRKLWLQGVNDDLNDLNTRTSDAEESVSDHEDRIDLLEANGPSADRIYATTLTLTDAQIKALPTTPVAIISAPDVGYRVTVHRVIYYTNFLNGGYSNIDPDQAWIVLQVPSTAWLGGLIRNDSTIALSKLTTVLEQTAPRTVDTGHYHTTDSGGSPEVLTTTAQVDGKAVSVAGDNNSAGAWTGGHVGNSLTVRVYYTVDAIPVYYAPMSNPRAAQAIGRKPRRRKTGVSQDGSTPLVLV